MSAAPCISSTTRRCVMLAFDLAVALFALSYGRPPSAAEHAALLAAVREMYAHLRVSPSNDAAEALTQLRTNARVRDVMDVALDAPTVSQPHSFITGFDELQKAITRNRALVIHSLGCAVYYKNAYYFLDETGKRQVTPDELRSAFEAQRPCRSVVLLQA